jgi:hypothetical protein
MQLRPYARPFAGCRVLGVLPLLPLAAPIHPEPSFRFWIDEVLWSQVRLAKKVLKLHGWGVLAWNKMSALPR